VQEVAAMADTEKSETIKSELDPASLAKIQKEFYHAAFDQINSINNRINIIMWIIIIAVILQVLFGLHIF
jgi:ABC-type nickel/cobalt efflux system permease component RcnA